MGQGGPSDPTAGAGVLAAGPSVPGVPERALNVAQIHGSKVPGLRFLLPGSQGTKIHCIRRESSVRPMDPVPSDDGRAQDPGYLRDQEGHRGPKDPKEPEKMHFDYGYVHAAAMLMVHQEITVPLRTGDTAVAPGTTKKVLRGPGLVTYRAYRDGDLDVMATTATLVRRCFCGDRECSGSHFGLAPR